jgi:hypothetical protein
VLTQEVYERGTRTYVRSAINLDERERESPSYRIIGRELIPKNPDHLPRTT